MKLTPWIDGTINPVRVGIYQRDYGDGIPPYCKFDGSAWYFGCYTIREASEEISISPYKNLPWRGLSEHPK